MFRAFLLLILLAICLSYASNEDYIDKLNPLHKVNQALDKPSHYRVVLDRDGEPQMVAAR